MDKIKPTTRMTTSAKHGELLDVIDQLRCKGVSHFVDLPQLIVCGDQSSGKSSVLEALSGLNFPRRETVCTRFATEVILRRGAQSQVDISIIPGEPKSANELDALFKLKKNNIREEEFAEVIKNTEKGMGIDGSSKNFSKDVLRVEFSGPKHPNLTLVDLPGLFHSGSKTQTDEDAEAVKQFVLGYMKSQRSIILAVISAKNDVNNQIVVKYAADVDPGGHRTLGIITKPDTLDVGSVGEKAFFELAENKDILLAKGFHVVKNRDFNNQGLPTDERDRVETEFFQKGIWAGLNPANKGIEALKSKLSDMLREQIILELPNLIQDVERAVKDTKSRLQRLGGSRETSQHQRIHLLRVSQAFVSLTRSAVDGQYDDPFFEDKMKNDAYDKRLRAVVQNHLAEFALELKNNGQTYQLVDGLPNNNTACLDENKNNEDRINKNTMLRKDYVGEVAELMKQTRGRELSSDYNPAIVGKLFSQQSRQWESIVKVYVSVLLDAARWTLTRILDHTSDNLTAEGIREIVINPAMIDLEKLVKEKAEMIIRPFQGGHPITYDPHLISLVRKKDEARLKNYWTTKFMESLKPYGDTNKVDKQGFFQSNQSFDIRKLINKACEGYMEDKMNHACNRAIDTMEAYYDVRQAPLLDAEITDVRQIARKNLVDSFSTLVIEECLMQKLAQLFTPETAHSLSDEDVHEIAAEDERSVENRRTLEEKHKVLEEALTTLHRLKRHKSQEGKVPRRKLSFIESTPGRGNKRQNGTVK